ncbi:hypothetical protein [Henriciella marina]|uniref:hypothetical protein n=1 Tax=Henriciella marina TaxID=453851 RepID=UPI000381D78E|nr:hypothetical protein [Henriciella marina]
MGGVPGFDGIAFVATVIAILLSAIASLLGTMTRKQQVDNGVVDAALLCELTGIQDPRILQDVFGPPTMNRMWQGLTLSDITSERRFPGYLISDDRVDWACIAVALVSFFWQHPLMDGLVITAAIVQIAGWALAYQLPRQV